jgi:membrane-bound lytic murein transglycosylase B
VNVRKVASPRVLLHALGRVRHHGPVFVATAVGTIVVLATAVAVALSQPTSSGGAATVAPIGLTTTAPTDPLALAPKPDLREFRQVARKPAAAAPIRKLPKVQLETVSVGGIPPVPLQAYRAAAQQLAVSQPGCHVPWWLVAGIGFVESGHAHSGGSLVVGWDGVARPPILGPVLDGSQGFMPIHDTDQGVYDGNRKWDRAIGPMQFLPSTWQTWGPPGNLDGHANAQNIRAAALATAGYLCASGSDVSQPRAMALAVFSYNHSFDYVRLVLSVGARYAGVSADDLGVNLLPSDREVAKKHARHHRSRHHARDDGGSTKDSKAGTDTDTSGTGSTDTSGGTATSPSPSPSPTVTTSPKPLPDDPVPTILPSIGFG